MITKKISLEANITSTMFQDAFKFGMNYFLNPAKTLKDRTGDKNRGMGEIITANLVGKLIELGVCKILEENSKVKQKFLPDMDVSSEFVYNQPDISKISRKKTLEDPKFFIEIKNSPTNFRWVSLYTTQFNEMKKWIEENMPNSNNPEEKIFIIYAKIVDKFGDEISVKDNEEEAVEEEAVEEEAVEEEAVSKNKSHLNKKEKEIIDDITKKIDDLETKKQNLPRCSKSLGIEKQEKCKKEKKELEKKIKIEENLKKNLLVTMPQRRKDLLGVFLKHQVNEIEFLKNELNEFYDIKDLKIIIDYIVSGKELKDHGREFEEKSIWPEPEIFLKKKDQKFEDTDKTKWKKITCKRKGDKKILPVEKIMSGNEQTYPNIFGEWICEGKFNVHQQIATRKNNAGKDTVNSTLFIECKTDVELCNDFLKNQNFQKGDIWSMRIKNILGGNKGKIRSDIAIPKNIVDDIITEKLSTRIIRIVKQI